MSNAILPERFGSPALFISSILDHWTRNGSERSASEVSTVRNIGLAGAGFVQLVAGQEREHRWCRLAREAMTAGRLAQTPYLPTALPRGWFPDVLAHLTI